MKIRNLLFLMALATAQLFGSLAQAREVVVLVPGFFNSFAPEYFSQDIINSFANKGFKVYVTTSLNPTGFIDENGADLEKVLTDIQVKEGADVSFNLVAHSAGGFYSLWVANRHKFKIKNIFTISTPYKGCEFVQNWLDNSFLFRELAALAKLDAIGELTVAGAKNFLASVRVAPDTKIYAFGGYQMAGFDVTDARNLSVPLRVTDFFTKEKSDGIVGYSSSLAVGEIRTTEGEMAKQYRDANYFINLEHWEQVLDSRTFVLLGTRNTDFIRKEQVRFYSGLADLLLKMQ